MERVGIRTRKEMIVYSFTMQVFIVSMWETLLRVLNKRRILIIHYITLVSKWWIMSLEDLLENYLSCKILDVFMLFIQAPYRKRRIEY